MGMFAAIVASTNILFFFIPVWSAPPIFSYFIPPFIENIGFILSTRSSSVKK